MVFHAGGKLKISDCNAYGSTADNDSGHPVFLPLCTIRSQLALLVGLTASAILDSQYFGAILLRRRLVRTIIWRLRVQQKPLLAASHHRDWSGMSTMVPNALGCLRDRPVRTMGRQPIWLCLCWTNAMALAGRLGCASERGVRSDIAAHADTVPYLLYTYRGAGSGISSDDCGQGYRSK